MHDTTELPELAEGAPDRLADRSRWMALVVLWGMLMIVLDRTNRMSTWA